MALVTLGWRLVVTLIDNGANVSTLTFIMRESLFATVQTDVATVLAALGAVTNSVISDYAVKEVFSENAFAYPAAGIENEDKASITVLLAGAGSKKANIKIPAPVIGLFTAPSGGGANVVDLSDADLITYTDIFRSGAECTISDGEDLSLLVSGKRISAKSNSG